jgi:hypothetical protein
MSDLTKYGAGIPANLGRAVDLYHDVRELRLLMEAEVKEVRLRESELKLHIINNLPRDSAGAMGMRYKAKRSVKAIFKFAGAKVDENEAEVSGTSGWQQLTNWIRQTGNFQFLQKRIGEGAVQEWIDAGNALPPGIEKFDLVDISVTKV